MDGIKRITLDLHDLAHLLAGGTLEVPSLGMEIMPGNDAQSIAYRVQTRVNGKRRRLDVKPRPAPEEE